MMHTGSTELQLPLVGGKKMDDPHALKSNEMAQCTFQPQQPLVCDTFTNCEGPSRVAFMDGNGVVMLGKVISCEKKDEAAAGGRKNDRIQNHDAQWKHTAADAADAVKRSTRCFHRTNQHV